MPLPFKKAKRRGIFCLSEHEKTNIKKEKLEKSINRKKQQNDAFNLLVKEHNERETELKTKLLEIEKKLKEVKDRMESEN